MQPTGIIRCIDDQGRLVIPKNIRNDLGIEDNDPLEIFADKSKGLVILTKYRMEDEMC